MAESEIKVNRVMLTILLFVATQAIAGIIWGSTLSVRVSYMSDQINKMEATLTSGTQFRYTSADASKDKELMHSLVSANGRRLEALEKRVDRLETQP